MVVTPDNHTLIVAESFAGRLTAFDIDDDECCRDADSGSHTSTPHESSRNVTVVLEPDGHHSAREAPTGARPNEVVLVATKHAL
jgi:sugar lactone lactonase YvrE